MTKDGTDASVPQDSDCRSESVLPEGHVHFTDEKDRPGQGKLRVSDGARVTNQPGGQHQGRGGGLTSPKPAVEGTK